MFRLMPTLGDWKLPAGVIAAFLFIASAGLQPAVAQTNGSGSEPSQQEVLTHYSLYYEDFKNEDYASALPNLRWMLENAPAAPQNDDRNFERAVELYSGLAENAESESETQAYLDTAYTILNEAPSRLDELGAEYSEYEWIMDKGRFIQQYASQMPDVNEEPETYYREAFNLAPDKMQAYYIDRIIKAYMNDNEQQKALTFMDEVEAKAGGKEKVMKIVGQYRQQIFGRNPQARIEFLDGRPV